MIDLKSLKEEGALYYLSPDKLYIIKLREFMPGAWRREMWKLKPKVKVAHPLRIVHSEPGYKLPDVLDATWTKLTVGAAVAAITKG